MALVDADEDDAQLALLSPYDLAGLARRIGQHEIEAFRNADRSADQELGPLARQIAHRAVEGRAVVVEHDPSALERGAPLRLAMIDLGFAKHGRLRLPPRIWDTRNPVTIAQTP